MNDQEILRQAARLSAQRRRRVVAACAVCGLAIEGTVRRRYCSAVCKLRAQRQRLRIQRSAAEDASAERPSLADRLAALRAETVQGRRPGESAAQIIREAREQRVAEQWPEPSS